MVTAADLQGNLTEETVQFTVPVENPSAEVTSFPTCDADGHISVTDPSGDDLNVSVRRGETVPVTDLEVTSGTVHDGAATDREGTAVTADELATLAEADGEGVSASAVDALPYQQFTAAVPDGTGAGDQVRVQWQGEANAGTRVTLFALSNDGGWVELNHQILAEDSTAGCRSPRPSTQANSPTMAKCSCSCRTAWAGLAKTGLTATAPMSP